MSAAGVWESDNKDLWSKSFDFLRGEDIVEILLLLEDADVDVVLDEDEVDVELLATTAAGV